MPENHQILIVDDHALLIDALELYLRQIADPLRIWRATSMLQALSIRDAGHHFDLVLLDLHMPDMDGIEGLSRLRERDPDMPIVIISGDDSSDTVASVMAAGANGFIPKTLKPAALQGAISRVLQGERYVPDSTELHPAPPPVDAQLHFTTREYEVLRSLIDGKSNKEIARKLGIEVVTVTTHLGKVYRKLGVSGRTQAVRRAMELKLKHA